MKIITSRSNIGKDYEQGTIYISIYNEEGETRITMTELEWKQLKNIVRDYGDKY